MHGRADPEWGEAVVATVVLRPGAEATRGGRCGAHCAERLARFKVPKAIAFARRAARGPPRARSPRAALR